MLSKMPDRESFADRRAVFDLMKPFMDDVMEEWARENNALKGTARQALAAAVRAFLEARMASLLDGSYFQPGLDAT